MPLKPLVLNWEFKSSIDEQIVSMPLAFRENSYFKDIIINNIGITQINI